MKIWLGWAVRSYRMNWLEICTEVEACDSMNMKGKKKFDDSSLVVAIKIGKNLIKFWRLRKVLLKMCW